MQLPNRSEQGWALLSALIALALVTSIAVEWQRAARSDLAAASRGLERSQARWALRGMLVAAGAALDADPTPTVDGPDDPWAQPPAEPFLLGAVEVDVRLVTADGLWDVNNLAAEPESGVREPLACWRDLAALSAWAGGAETGRAIRDWIDEDNRGIAEADHYLARTPPETCKNAPIDAPGELAGIRGFDPRWFAGGRDPDSGVEWPPLRERVVVLPRATAAGITPVNVNFASTDTVRAVIGLDRLRTADRLTRRRDAAAFVALDEVEQTIGADAWAASGPYLSVRSAWVRVEAEARVGDTCRRARAWMQRPTGGSAICRRWSVSG